MLPKRYRTFVLDDRFYEQEAIVSLLRKIPEIDIVGVSKLAAESLEICRQKKPELIIVDGKLYGRDDLSPTFVRNIRKILPETRILGMTRYGECIDLLNSAGCDFVIDKNMIESQESFLSYIKESVLPQRQPVYSRTAPRLTPEEKKVLRLMCAGRIEKEIAAEMGFSSRKPVRRIKNSLFEKFGAENSLQLVSLAHQSGILNGEEA